LKLFQRNIRAALVAALALTVGTLGSVMGGTDSYAQSRACPEGFSLNRGVCQAEPEASCDFLVEQGYGAPRIKLTDDNKQCSISHAQYPLCEEGYYDSWHDQCEDPVGYDTTFATENQNIYCPNGEDPEFLGTELVCIIGYDYVPAELECDVGELNEDSGMCEVKPGRRNR
jgi:hypothetical protein